MSNIAITEQWLLDGNCEQCRRSKYCSKPCGRCKGRAMAAMSRAVATTVANVMAGAGVTNDSTQRAVYEGVSSAMTVAQKFHLV